MKVLILNSDSPNNRGDRAILQGLIALIKDIHPNAQITSLSQFSKRDADWFGIDFLPFSPYSTSPIDFLKLLSAARRADLVLWGGGELLKDYTNKLSLFYWALKLFGVRLVNRRIIGAFQGIGPTKAKISKWAILKSVNQCKVFLVRDQESKTKLDAWGVKTKVVASFDPAVYTTFEPGAGEYVGLGLRRWFHYRRGGWLPAKYRFWESRTSEISPLEQQYVTQIVDLANWITAQGLRIKFIPMHMSASEDDAGFALQMKKLMNQPESAEIVSSDDLSPDQLLGEIGSCKFFVASRLHSAILATVANVPSICLYYVDKGRLFFDQIGLSEFAKPIELMTEAGASEQLVELIENLVSSEMEVKKNQLAALEQMRSVLKRDLAAALDEVLR